MTTAVKQKRFWWLAGLTVAIIYTLILVGGVVRATGAGMGCPDWPTCFDRWIPPISEAELPPNYQEIYADRGYADTTFNVRKTWTEYLNRLLGVFTGFAIFLTMLGAWGYRKSDPLVFHLAVAGFIMVGVQGWLGSRVVATNLHVGMITVHMLLAQVIVGTLIWAVLRSAKTRLQSTHVGVSGVYWMPLLVGVLLFSLLQLLIGTQVREAVDLTARAANHTDRHLWIDNLPLAFTIHKWTAIPLAVVTLWMAFRLLSQTQSRFFATLCWALAAMMGGTVVMGWSMERLNLPMFAQPLHLWLASLICGVQLAMLITLRYAQQGQASITRSSSQQSASSGHYSPSRS